MRFAGILPTIQQCQSPLERGAPRHLRISLPGKTIHEITEEKQLLFVLFRVISWIALDTSGLVLSSEVTIVPCDFPCEQNIFHAGAGADVMYDQIALRGFVPDIHDHPDMFGSAKLKIPRD